MLRFVGTSCLSVILSVVALAQPSRPRTPSATERLQSRLAAAETPRHRLLAEHPGAVEHIRLPNANIFRLPDGRYRGVFGPGLGWVRPDSGEIVPNAPALWTTADGWSWVGAPVETHITRNLDGTDDVGAFRQTPDGWQGVALAVPRVAYAGGSRLSFRYQMDWEVHPSDVGFELRSLPVAAARGVQTYEFAVKLLNVAALTVDADGNLTDGADFRLSRALMLGTNSVIYPCSAWRLPAPDRVQFSCDDSTLPKRAYPYVIDPTTSFSPAASGDDGHLEGYGASWPPGYTRSITDYPQFSVVNSYDGAEYAWSVGLIRYDTSGLTADATITDALAYIWPSFRSDKDNFSVRAEYYGTVYWPIGSDDYTTSVGDNAIADVDLGTLSTGTWHGLTMTTLGNINKTGYTGLRWGLTSSQPTDYNSLGPQSFDGGSQYCPYLSITYTVPARPFIIVVTDSTP